MRQLPPIAKWLLGIFAALITASVVGGGTTLSSHTESIAKHGAQIEGLHDGQRRIEGKLDKIVEHLLDQ